MAGPAPLESSVIGKFGDRTDNAMRWRGYAVERAGGSKIARLWTIPCIF